jgi:hypothetical protein
VADLAVKAGADLAAAEQTKDFEAAKCHPEAGEVIPEAEEDITRAGEGTAEVTADQVALEVP